MTTSTRSSSAPTLRQVRPALWRVLREDGTLAGYIEGAEPVRFESVRFEARRLVASTRQVVGLGHFASIDDAMLCFS
ncbi:hypothetical protein [Subtercola endophyticus]|uniref:hypothetical protein n=1 Tax=Subtercola endophyticus TaxID=2895559 RepID=UPI001E326B5D|nr:hypothetical protein [Subtercola endophyticus]UFS60896.1 hypothetical protein LQ955_09255 [Subtercola endophyticus]